MARFKNIGEAIRYSQKNHLSLYLGKTKDHPRSTRTPESFLLEPVDDLVEDFPLLATSDLVPDPFDFI